MNEHLDSGEGRITEDEVIAAFSVLSAAEISSCEGEGFESARTQYAAWVEQQQASVGMSSRDQIEFDVRRIALLKRAGLVDYAASECADLETRIEFDSSLNVEERESLREKLGKLRS